ncbi:unnamed protein product [Caenorhabditis brenneri]
MIELNILQHQLFDIRMFPVLNMPDTALRVLMAMYTFQEKINLSLACAQAKRVLRYITLSNAVMILKVAIKFDQINHYVEMDAFDEQKKYVARWIFYKRATDFTTEHIIGDTYVEIDLAYSYPGAGRPPLTNIQTFHVLRSAAAFIDHVQDIYQNLIVDISFDSLSSLDLKQMPLIHRWITRSRKIKFQECTIPDHEMLHLQELFQSHHNLIVKYSQFRFSNNFAVHSIKLRSFDSMEDFISKNFHLFQCQVLDFQGDFSEKQVLKIIRCWKSGRNPLLKKIKIDFSGELDKVFSPLRAKAWSEPGPRMFKLGDFELDCADGRDVRGPQKSIGTLKYTEQYDNPALLFVVWD